MPNDAKEQLMLTREELRTLAKFLVGGSKVTYSEMEEAISKVRYLASDWLHRVKEEDESTQYVDGTWMQKHRALQTVMVTKDSRIIVESCPNGAWDVVHGIRVGTLRSLFEDLGVGIVEEVPPPPAHTQDEELEVILTGIPRVFQVRVCGQEPGPENKIASLAASVSKMVEYLGGHEHRFPK